MGVKVAWVEWDWLAGLPTPAARLDAWRGYMAAGGGGSSPLPPGFAWNDSDTDHYLVGEEFDRAVVETGEPTAGLIRRAFPLLGVAAFTRAEDALGLRPLAGNYFASLPPASVRAVVAAAGQLDLADLAGRMDPEQPAEVLAYLRQWVVPFDRAAAEGRGIIAHTSG